jgi:hypothetical protein
MSGFIIGLIMFVIGYVLFDIFRKKKPVVREWPPKGFPRRTEGVQRISHVGRPLIKTGRPIVKFKEVEEIEDFQEPKLKKGEKPPYVRKPSLMNSGELELYKKLVEACPNYIVLGQIRLADIVRIEKGLRWEKENAWFNKIKSKSVDFVVCDKEMRVKICIELDGPHHAKPDQRKADAVKDEALTTCSIPILRLDVRDRHDVHQLGRKIALKILHS